MDISNFYKYKDTQKDEQYFRIVIVARSFDCASTIIFMILHFMILKIYLKYSKIKRLNADMLERIARKMQTGVAAVGEKQEHEQA